MLFNRLFVKPTAETMAYLVSAMSGAPLDIDAQNFKVEVITSKDALTPEPDRVYEAQAFNVKVFYDSYLQQSNLICTLHSADLQQRCLELNEQGVVREFYDWYIPHMVIRPNMPALSRHYRTFVVSLANVLCANERPLYFSGEYVEQQDLQAPPLFDYMQAMAEEMRFRHNV